MSSESNTIVNSERPRPQHLYSSSPRCLDFVEYQHLAPIGVP